MTDRLTDKQQEVLRMAYLSGYFSWPRRSTAEECADALGIAQPTFSQHVRAAQEKVIDRLFEDDLQRWLARRAS
jgi:predicted DNA binding protein